MISPIAEKKIYQVLTKKISLHSFEQWLYEDNVLESNNPNLYFELISFDYSVEDNFNYFYDDFAKYVHFYKFEAERIAKYLYSIISKNENYSHAIWMMYELCCDGYGFLGKIGMVYGFSLVDEVTSASNRNIKCIFDKFYPSIVHDATNVLNWLEEGRIVFKDEQNGYGGFEYDDFCSETEILQGQA